MTTATAVLTVYHGTGAYALEPIRAKGPEKNRRNYTRRPCFCTTTDLAVARRFAARKTGADDFLAGRLTGVVLEYRLDGDAGKDYAPARDPSCMQDEREVAVFNTKRLALAAVWRHDGTKWVREPV